MLTKIMFLIFMTMMMASCQQKEASSVMSGDFYSPEYQVTPPLNKWHKTGDTISFTLILPYDVTVTGSPYVNSIIGSTYRRFYYSSGSGSKTLTFTYTVLTGDKDTDGITFDSKVTLNGGSLTYVDTAGEQREAPLDYTIPSNNARVDGVKAMLTVVSAPSTGIYLTGQYLNYVLSFTEDVYVSGAQPYLAISMNSGVVNAEYVSGSGTNALKFRRKIVSTDIDGDGISTATTLYNSTSIKDIAGNSISAVITATSSPSALVNTTAPLISTVTPPANATYGVTQDLVFQLTMSAAVQVTGTPKLQVNLTTGTAYALYTGIDATNTILSFKYTTVSGQADFDGITLAPQIIPAGGTIVAVSNGQNAVLGFTPPSMPNVKVDAVDGPSAVFAVVPSPATYVDGQNLDISLTFNNSVTVTGTPRIPITIGSATVYADYNSSLSSSGVMVFRYTVASGDADIDGINIVSPINLNGGTIKDSMNRNANLYFSSGSTSSVYVDGQSPYLTSITPPTSGMYPSGTSLDFVITMNEAVVVTGTPRIQFTLDSGTAYANFISGSGTNTLIFRLTPVTGDYDISGGPVMVSPISLNGGTITDLVSHNAVLTFGPPSLSSIVIDSAPPTVTSITSPSNGTYAIGSTINFTVNWSEAVTINSMPTLPITLNTGGTVNAVYNPTGSTSTATKFTYTVTEGTLDTDGITVVGTLSVGSGSIRDSAGNNATLTFAAPSLPSVKVDGIRPQVTVPVVPTPGTYVAGQVLQISLPWTESVTVTGSPTMTMTIGSSALSMSYDVTSPGTTSVFKYTVASNNFDNDGVTVLPAIYLNGGSIKDAAGNDAVLVMSVPSMSTVYVDAVLPGSTSTLISQPGTYNYMEDIDFKVFWNEDVAVTGTPRLTLTVGSTTRYLDYVAAASTPLISVFRYTVSLNDYDNDGIAFNPASGTLSISLNGGTIKDLAGNNAVLTVDRPVTSGVLVDGTIPVITSITAPTGTKVMGDDLDITVTYSKAIDVTGVPSIDILVGGIYRQAYYVSGTGTTNLIFRYSISVQEEQKFFGIYVRSPVSPNGGTMKDAGLVNAKLTFTNRWLIGTFIDSKGPTVSFSEGKNSSLTSTKYFKAGQQIYFYLTFHENFVFDTSGGFPSLSIDVGGTTRTATYDSYTSSQMVFKYTLDSSNNDLDIDGIGINSIVLNGAVIEDVYNNPANLTFSLTNKVYAYFSNMIARYNFESSNISQYACGAEMCASYVYDISGNNKHISTTSSPGPVVKSGFGLNSTPYVQFDETSYLQLPPLSSVKYYAFALKTPTNVSTNATDKNHYFFKGYYPFSWKNYFTLVSNWTQKKTVFYQSSKFTNNSSGSGAYGTTFTSPAWTASTYSIFVINSASPFSTAIGYLGQGFSGQLAEAFFMDSSATLSDSQLQRLEDQLNTIHQAY